MKISVRMFTVSLLLVCGAAVAKDRVTVIMDESFDFSSIRTFDFPALEDHNRGPVYDEAVAVLQNRTVEHLAPKGFRRDRENPDFYIMFNGRMGDSVELIGGYRFKVSKNVVWETYAGPGWSRSTGHGLVILYMQLPEAEEPFWGAGSVMSSPRSMAGFMLTSSGSTLKVPSEISRSEMTIPGHWYLSARLKSSGILLKAYLYDFTYHR